MLGPFFVTSPLNINLNFICLLFMHNVQYYKTNIRGDTGDKVIINQNLANAQMDSAMYDPFCHSMSQKLTQMRLTIQKMESTFKLTRVFKS